MEYHDTRILIADENQSSRTQIREALTRAGYRHIEEATGGDDALAKIDRSHPDIALIDIWLSQLDGIGVIRACRNLDFRSDHAPVFIMTSPVSNQNMFIQAAGAGAALCLIKSEFILVIYNDFIIVSAINMIALKFQNDIIGICFIDRNAFTV